MTATATYYKDSNNIIQLAWCTHGVCSIRVFWQTLYTVCNTFTA